MTIEDVKKELGEHLANNAKIVPSMVYSQEVALDKLCKVITSVKGTYPSFHSIMTNVVQGFKPQWQALGALQIKSKALKTYRQKVNFSIIPAEILSSYLAGDYYEEDKDLINKTISQYILEEELKPKVIDDLNWLSVMGVRDDLNADGQFGKSLNGAKQVVADAVAHATHPAFKIPLSALTDVNIVDQVTDFEAKLPEKAKMKVKAIVMSHSNSERYQRQYVAQYSDNQFKNDTKKTFFGREIVALPFLDDDTIWATTEGNLVKLIDKIDNPPAITDLQKADYELKIFMEFSAGYDFLINEMVFVSNYATTAYGLSSTADNQLYYGIDGVIPI